MRTEVTNAQYARCVEAKRKGDSRGCEPPHNNRWNDSTYTEHPVTYVTWNQAKTYVEWVSGRLATEAEWEKACRGTDEQIYPWGNQAPTALQLNFDGRVGDTTPVEHYPAGANGLYDMAGNVGEWTADWYDATYYANSPSSNPKGSGSGDYRTYRGGSWDDGDVSGVRCAKRGWYDPSNKPHNVEFRVVRHETAREN